MTGRNHRTSLRDAARGNLFFRRIRSGLLAALLLIPACGACGVFPADILDLQPQKSATRISVSVEARRGQVELIALNPVIGAWYVLRVDLGGAEGPRTYHLENPTPLRQTLGLSAAFQQGLVLGSGTPAWRCSLWGPGSGDALEAARRSGLAYAPLCGGRLYLRNPVKGTYTQIEKTTDFLRDHVWGGERVVTFVREAFFKDAFLEGSASQPAQDALLAEPPAEGAPPPPVLDPGQAGRMIEPAHLGLDLGVPSPLLQLGRWYPLRGASGIFLSAIEPRAVAAVPQDRRRTLNPLDAVESSALAYLVAFDLNAFDVGFALGTDHPRVGWSERVLPEMRDERPGPDGIGRIDPLVSSGMVAPWLVPRTAAAFTGGFKRRHGAFHFGDLAQRNAGSHYGFIEQGTIFSELQQGLATLFVRDDGFVDMKTWTAADDAQLPRLRHARQTGVALVEHDDVTGLSSAGSLVTRWGDGNWSASTDEKLRTLRAGACLRESQGRRYLVYGYFSAASPSAMARVFLAYGCCYALQLDINALEHTYLAIYTRKAGRIVVEHLIEGMAEVDKKGGDALAPRFIGFPDDRDFFYLVRRGAP